MYASLPCGTDTLHPAQRRKVRNHCTLWLLSTCLLCPVPALVTQSISSYFPGPQGASRHGLIYGLDAIAHGKFIHNFLGCLIKVHLPCIVPSSLWDPDSSTALNVCEVMEKVLQNTEQRERWVISTS